MVGRRGKKERKEGRKEGWFAVPLLEGRSLFLDQGGKDGKVWRRGGEDVHLWWDVFQRERHGVCNVVVVASEVRERSENVIRSDEGEDRKEEENEQAKEGGRYHNRR